MKSLTDHELQKLVCMETSHAYTASVRIRADDRRTYSFAVSHYIDTVLEAGSSHEILTVHLRSKGKDPHWEPTATANLGPITITAQALGRFVPGEPRRLVIGTSNGWLFLLDSAGRAAAERKFLSPVRSLTAIDLDRDGRDELVVVLGGASENVLIFSPQTTP